MLEFLRVIYGREVPANPAYWHRRQMWFPVQTIDGTWASRVWRRWRNGRWEYAGRSVTDDDRSDLAW